MELLPISLSRYEKIRQEINELARELRSYKDFPIKTKTIVLQSVLQKYSQRTKPELLASFLLLCEWLMYATVDDLFYEDEILDWEV